MASSKHPIDIVDAPAGVERFANVTSGICVNLRADRWPEGVLKKYQEDWMWGVRVGLNESHLTAPWLTDFLKKLNPGDNFLASVQDAGESVYTVTGQIREICWIDRALPPLMSPSPCGKLAAIRPVKSDYKEGLTAGFQIWTSYVLAIACLAEEAPPNSRKDPEGKRFIELALKHGVRVLE